jgi:hypothetical protein
VDDEAGREAPELLFSPGPGLVGLAAGAIDLREGGREGGRKGGRDIR